MRRRSLGGLKLCKSSCVTNFTDLASFEMVIVKQIHLSWCEKKTDSNQKREKLKSKIWEGKLQRGEDQTHEFNSAGLSTPSLESPSMWRQHSFVPSHYSVQGKCIQVKNKNKNLCARQWMDNKKEKPIIAVWGDPADWITKDSLWVWIGRRECHAYECPNNDLYVSKVNHLFDEIVCELQAFVINSTGCL